MRNSGASRILLPYRVHRAGVADAVADAMATGSVGNPVTDIQIVSGQLVVSYADGSTAALDLPAGGGTVDPAEVQALIDTHAGMSDIHHAPGVGGGGSLILGNLDNAQLPGPAIAMRMGWGQTNPPMTDVFIRDGDSHHPQDGAAVGTSVLTYMPPFPPSLVAEHTLFVFIWLEGSPTNVEIVVNPGLDNQGYFTSYFSDGDPLEVAGVAGTVYVSLFQFSSNESLGFASPRPGPILATQTWVTSQITGGVVSVPGDDQTARDAAAAAQADVDAHEATTHNTDTTARDAVVAHEATTHNMDDTARANAATAQAAAEAAQAEIDDHETNHPSGGSSDYGQLDGTWTFTFTGTNITDGEAHYAALALPGEVDTWLFGTTGTFQPSRARLLALEIGDEIEISQSGSRHQTVTLTELPTDVAGDVRVMGTADRATATEIPSANASVTVTLAAGPMDAVDQTARDAAATAHGAAADTAQTAADAKASASDIATAITDHAAMPSAHHVKTPAGGGGGASVERLLLTMPSSSYEHRIATALYFGTGESIWTVPYPTGHTLDSMTAAFKTGVVQRDTDFTTEIGPPCTEAFATQLWGYAPGGTIDEYRVDLTAGGIVLAIPSAATLPTNQQDAWFVRLTLVT